MFYGLSLGPPWVEGLRNSVKAIATSLVKKGFEVSVVTKGSFGRVDVEGVEYFGLPLGDESYSSGAFRVIGALSNWLLRKRFDIVHGHASFPILSLPSFFARSKRFFTLYSPLFGEVQVATEYSSLQKTLFSVSKSALVTRVSAFWTRYVCISKRVRDTLPLGVRERSAVIPVGVDYARFSKRVPTERLKEELGLNFEYTVLFAGDVTPWKGGEDFLFSSKIVKQEIPSTNFLFLTKGTYEFESKRLQALKALVQKLDLQRNVKFLGQVRQIEALYQLSDVVVLPFRSVFSMMSTPLSLLEAMASGKPVVATRVGDIPEIIKHEENGLLVKPRDHVSLARCVLRALTDKSFAEKISSNAKSFARSRDWSVVVDSYIRLYKN